MVTVLYLASGAENRIAVYHRDGATGVLSHHSDMACVGPFQVSLI